MKNLRRFDLYNLVQRVQERIGRRLRVGLKRALIRLLVGVIALIILTFLGIEYTSRSSFCSTCHFMEPYVASWKASRHHDVPCIECHLPPEIEGYLTRKFASLNQVTKYVTRQYGTRPWTEISDSACLRGGCHEKRLLVGETDFNGVKFDHSPHLSSFRRVTRLRCTSCHSQIVQGEHITATSFTCYLCHFKNLPGTEAMAECETCHKLPIQTKLASAVFDHRMVEERGVSCKQCHADVIQGTGMVPRERCLECHAEPEHLARYDDIAFMHENHVTTHKINCTRCHQEIQHRLPKQVARPTLDCLSCHPSQHEETLDLYAGEGGVDAPQQSDPMFVARVSCLSCHRTHVRVPGEGMVLAGGAAGCMNCHGESYGRLLSLWKNTATAQLQQIEPALDRAAQEIARAQVSGDVRQKVDEILNGARQNVQLVRGGGGVHNIRYATDLLAAVVSQANRALALAGSSYRVPAPSTPSWLAQGNQCLDCHPSAPEKPIAIFGVSFDHGRHLYRARLSCTSCHGSEPLGTPQHGRLAIGKDACVQCHAKMGSPHPANWRSVHGGRGDRSCQICHAQKSCQNCHGLTMPHPSGWVRSHGPAAADRSLCLKCHKTETCSSCHTQSQSKPASHDAKWPKAHGKVALKNLATCQVCHRDTRRFCDGCHGVAMPHPSDWASAHGPAVVQGAGVCLTCHAPRSPGRGDYCMTCHEGAPPSNHDANWKRNHPSVGWSDMARCSLCHGTDSCNACHGLAMPHTADWPSAHGARANSSPDLCLRCHAPRSAGRGEYCMTCHEGAPPASHDSNWKKSHATAGQQQGKRCSLCHGSDSCNACHGLSMPHPDDFITAHSQVASFEPKASCFKCHDRQEFCATCHVE